MRKIELVSGVNSSRLGFGCAPILGAVGGKAADRALHCALDAGVNHFDVARSYGYGEAEAFLGKFFKGRRDQVVIVSKFGIQATWKARLLRPLKPMVRALRRRGGQSKGNGASEVAPIRSVEAPAAERCSRKDPFHERIAITPGAMVANLDKSLRALRCDYLDLLMVHEPTGKLEGIEELAGTAADLKKQGKIRGWGLAFDWSTAELHAPQFDRFDVLQFDNSPEAGHYTQALDQREDAANIFFSPFRQRKNLLPAEVLKQLWSDFPKSVVLCSMFSLEHIMSNAELANL